MKAILFGSLFMVSLACVAPSRTTDVPRVTIPVGRVDHVAEEEHAADPPIVIYEWVSGRCVSQSEPSPEAVCLSIGEVVRRPDGNAGRRVRLNAFVSVDDDGHAWLTDGIPPYEKVRVVDWASPPCRRLGHFIVEADVVITDPDALSLAVELRRAVSIGVADTKTNCDVAPCRPGEGCPER